MYVFIFIICSRRLNKSKFRNRKDLCYSYSLDFEIEKVGFPMYQLPKSMIDVST